MFEYDPKKISEVAGNFTARLMVPRPDRVESSDDGPTPSVGCGGRCHLVPRPAVWRKPPDAPSNTGRSGTTTGSSGLCRTLGRIFRSSRVAPLQTERPGPPVPTTVPPRTPAASAARASSAMRSTSNSRLGNGARTKKRLSVCPWTSWSDYTSNNASNKSRPRKCHRLRQQSNRIVPVVSQAVVLSRQGLRKTTAAGDLSALDISRSRPENTELKKSSRMLLARLLSLFTGCIGKPASPPPEKSRSLKPPLRSEHEDRELGKTTTAEASRHPGEKVGCCPCARPAAVAPGSPTRIFWVGSRDDSEDNGVGCSMGHVLSTGVDPSQEQKYRKLKTVAHKQTSVTAEDIRKTALELQNAQQSNQQSSELADKSSPQQDKEGESDAYPTITETDLRPVCKEPGRPLILGRGQSGVVRLMRLRRPEGGSSLVAVKRLTRGSSRTQAAMTKEISALQAVELCPIFPKFVGVTNKQSFAQEYIGNPKSFATLSITKALRGKPPISAEHWVLIIHDVITGLSALHQSGWAHCDLQTNNVLLWRDRNQSDLSEARWEGRIIDLGNAKRLKGPTSYCLNLSPSEKAAYYRDCRHIPAEVVKGLVPYGDTSDIYSMGVLMKDIASRVTAMFELTTLAETCLADDPKQRPSLGGLLKDLNVWCQDHTGYRFSPVERKRVIAYV